MSQKEGKPTIEAGDLVKIALDGLHFDVGLVVEQEPDQRGFWHVYSRGRVLLVAEWNIVLLEAL